MNIQTLETCGNEPAMHGMRNPMNSWDKSDSDWDFNIPLDDTKLTFSFGKYRIGEKDKELSQKLQKSGPEHCKHLRMIFVWADITAPRYWWNEFDTYRIGVEKVSCSTMHKLMARPIDKSDFEHDCMNDWYLDTMVKAINESMLAYELCKDPEHRKEIWRGIIQALPQSYLQKRTVCMSYAALRNIVRQRAGHKLSEWKQFIDWAKTLPESWMIFDDMPEL